MHAAAITPTILAVDLPVGEPTAAPASRRRVPGLARLRAVIAQSRGHGLWIASWSIVGWAGTALAPTLADQPFLLMLLSPRALFVALASDSVSLIPFVLLGTLRLGITDASYFIVGKRFPRAVLARSNTPRTQRWKQILRAAARKGDRLCRWCCARPKLAGAFLFFRPNGKYLALAGAYGVRAWVAGLSSAAGTATFLAAMHIGLRAVI